jgi:diaminopimelate epimerase
VRTADTPARTLVVDVDMGPVRIAPEPVVVTSEGRSVSLTDVNVGNPHAVLFDRAHFGDALESTVHAVEARRDVFPDGVNVEFATIVAPKQSARGGALFVKVHERGVGWTHACGTGACAAAAAAVLHAWHPAFSTGTMVEVHFGSGVLEVMIERDGSHADRMRARLRGPARRVFEGMLEVA